MTPELKKAATLESLLTLAEPELIDVLQRTSLKAYEQYCLNRALIDMAFIPEEHQARFALTHAFAPS
jgi:hypothetical protein